MSTAASPVDDPIFDASQYDLPIPRTDGVKADKILVAFSGQIELDRTSEEDLAFLDSLMLGRDVKLSVSATVAKKGQTFSAGKDDSAPSSGFGVGLRVHSLEVPS